MQRCKWLESGGDHATQLASLSARKLRVVANPSVSGGLRNGRKLDRQRPVQCIATTGVKLPATHLAASQAALQQLKAASKGVNSECFDTISYILSCIMYHLSLFLPLVSLGFNALRVCQPGSGLFVANQLINVPRVALSQDMLWKRKVASLL